MHYLNCLYPKYVRNVLNLKLANSKFDPNSSQMTIGKLH